MEVQQMGSRLLLELQLAGQDLIFFLNKLRELQVCAGV
jgi:hypothetical protein